MELGEVPRHLVVVGGGYIGLEFGQLFRRLGSAVTIIQSEPRLLTREDDDIADEVRKILEEDGIEVLLNASAQSVRREGDGVEVTVKAAGGERVVSGSHLLLAVGRIPNSDMLNLAAAGIEADPHGYIRVNEYLETNVPGIYAIGDVKGGPAFTHISYDDYRVAGGQLARKETGQHCGADGAGDGVYRSAAGPDRVDGAGGARAGEEDSRGEDAGDLDRAGAGERRVARSAQRSSSMRRRNRYLARR